MKLTPLGPWIARKIKHDQQNGRGLTRELIEAYQLEKLRQTLELVSTQSIFYQHHLAGCDLDLRNLDQLKHLPFTTADDIKKNPVHFLTVSQGEIDRIVTLQSSGTTGQPKRIYFTTADQELTIDFFQQGMATFVEPGDRVLILLPGKNPGSVGDLLRQGLARHGVEGIVYGPVFNPAETLEVIQKEEIDCLVGIPVQVLSLARYRDTNGLPVSVGVKNVLLSTDYVPEAVVQALQEAWGCRVFNHYGSTEMGLGGGVECAALKGYHLREADLYFEVVDPVSGEVLPDGEYGEVVFTTLTRQGMPLIRYKTGDFSRFLKEPCPCGTVLKRLDSVKGRLMGTVELRTGNCISISELDETILRFKGVVDFSAELREGNEQVLTITVFQAGGNQEPVEPEAVLQALMKLVQLENAVEQRCLKLRVQVENGEQKRRITSSKRLIAIIPERDELS